ncbi:uncharacterized protein LOC115758306 [Drosophila novamexicana]|uniref:uncharacterized protein LOC115758306 n=1 Tax=Drosophila novamexicana TaxID=47314 RepID=UPI0011E5B86E|nr:uncharacterized protein LOC115758306 [Drosophila novamexicana]
MQIVHSLCSEAPAAMRLLEIVILTLIVVYPDEGLSAKRPNKASKKPDINGPCGKRYLRQINGKCYYFAGKKMNWFGAQNNCLRKNLNLADLATREEYNGIVYYLRARGNMEDFWFGGNDLQTEGRFTYISTGRPVRYFGGLKGIEATFRANLDDCLEIRLRQNTTGITDDNCQEKQYFICQTNAVKCAQPVEGGANDTQHSHEHLHHFHHDTEKGKEDRDGSENRDNEQRDVESDSRPADNSNSTEVRELPAEASGENTSANGEENTPMAEESLGTTIVPPANGGEGTLPAPEGTATANGTETSAPAKAEGETPVPPAEGAETPVPPAAGAETPAPPAEGAEAAAPPAEGAETPAAPTGEGAGAEPAPAGSGEAAAPEKPPEDQAETPAPENPDNPAGRAPKTTPVEITTTTASYEKPDEAHGKTDLATKNLDEELISTVPVPVPVPVPDETTSAH